MSRDYIRLHAQLADHPKWIGLAPLDRGAWTTLALAAITRDGRFTDHAHASAILRRDGFPAPAERVDALVKARLLDVEDGGALVMHDWSTHQAPWRGPSDDADAAAARKRKSRRMSRDVTTSHDLSRLVTSGHDRVEEIRGEESREEKVPSRARDDDDVVENDDDDLEANIAYRRYMADAANRLIEAEKHAAKERPADWLELGRAWGKVPEAKS